MESLLAELNTQEDINIHYARSYKGSRPSRFTKAAKTPTKSISFDTPASSKQCVICKAAGRRYQGHDISSCWYVSKFEKLEIAKAFQITVDDVNDIDSDNISATDLNQIVTEPNLIPSSDTDSSKTTVRKVECDVFPFFFAFYNHHPCNIVIDTGATSSVISRSFLKSVGIAPSTTMHSARAADKGRLNIEGEIHLTLNFGEKELPITALVLDNLDCDLLAGIPFCKSNDIQVHLKSECISIGDVKIPYGAKSKEVNIYKVDSYILRNDSAKVIMPGEFLEVQNNELRHFDGEVAIEPRIDSPLSGDWPSPAISRVIQGSVRIPNLGNEPIQISRSQHIAQIRQVLVPSLLPSDIQQLNSERSNHSLSLKEAEASQNIAKPPLKANPPTYYSINISVDPDHMLSKEEHKNFNDINKMYDSIFSPTFGAYNDKSGPIRASVNIGPVEPTQRKGKLPLYSSSNLQRLQEEADNLDNLERLGVTVKYVSPSFLVKKPDGSFRFVTAFNNLNQYVRILPTTTTTCDEVLRKISAFKYLIKTDFTKSFFQIKVASPSIPYLATVTPFKGLRVYLRSAMGMAGSSEYLHELTARVFGDFMKDGFVAMIADDLFVGGNTIAELSSRWERVLQRMRENNLTLNAKKTVICPKKTVILGWSWSLGVITPVAHKVSALSSVAKPKTCTAMKSFIGAFRAIARCIPRYSSLLSPLEESIKGLQGAQLIEWTQTLESYFDAAQNAVKSPRALTIPVPDDKLVLTVDASPLNDGLGATLFVLRDSKRLLAAFYSFKLKTHQIGWLPCELEALAISAGVNHFSSYIRESAYPMQVLTDSKPCVQAYHRLCQGQFSASARVSTFLATLSSHNIIVCHIAGVANPSSDFSSRNPQQCTDNSCQICKFVHDTAQSVVNTVSVSDVLAGRAQVPFTNHNAWKSAQQNCPDLRRGFAHLTQGTKPSRKARHLKHLRKYLNVATVDDRGVVIVRKQDSTSHQRSLIVVPYDILPGIITALHLYLKHSTESQLLQVFNRYFFGIKSASVIKDVVNQCNQCNSMKSIPKEIFSQTASSNPSAPGDVFFADVMRRSKQKIFVTRDVHSSYTWGSIIDDETAESLRAALLINTSFLRGDSSVIRVDTAPGFQSLKDNPLLIAHGIKLDFGRIKNKDSNSVIDKAIQELENEILKQDPSAGPLSHLTLQLALETLNSRIRNRGFSAKEILLKRDQHTNAEITMKDTNLAKQQCEIRKRNHDPSSRSKAHGRTVAAYAKVKTGDLVYIKDEKQKSKARDQYIITHIEKNHTFLQKLGNNFMSRQYEVPMDQIFPAIPPKTFHDWDNHKQYIHGDEDDDSSDCDINDQSNLTDSEIDISEHSEDDTYMQPQSEQVLNDDSLPSQSRGVDDRPQRNRRPPLWARSGDYDFS